MGSILHAIEVRPFDGDTVFVSMARVFENMSDPVKSFLWGLEA